MATSRILGNDLLLDQLTWHWEHQLRPRLDGLSDAEYLWEPTPGAWSVRRRGTATTAMAVGGGDMVIDFELSEGRDDPVTTIAWRLGHVIVGVLGARSAAHFAGPPTAYDNFEYAASADAALAQLDAAYDTWVAGVASLGEDGLARPCGPAEGPFADAPLAMLVLHIHREVIHHGAEVALLRDLWARRTELG